jgi:hypothetical protein
MIDHIFMLIDPEGPAIGQMRELGLVETYRRVHPGQGTRNVCYCFDNMFLELLWVDDPNAALGPTIRRTGLYDRSLWRSQDVCPFGIAWRAPVSGAEPAISTWAFSPPYLPEGMTIAVAEDSDDVRQPMMFRSPGSAPPIDWLPEKRGDLQHGCGLGAVQEITLTMPASAPPCDALKTIAADCEPRLMLAQGHAWHLEMRIAGLNGRSDLILAIPD